MIIFSSSMGKSGSTFIANMQEDILAIAIPDNGQKALFRICGTRFYKRINLRTAFKLIYISKVFGSIVVKTHSEPTWIIRLVIRLRLARATFSYRDLRDVILSALDHGKRNRNSGSGDETFLTWVDVMGSIPFANKFARNWQKWNSFGKVHFIGYETLMVNQLAVFCEMSEYLGWKIDEEAVQELIEKHHELRSTAVNFNKGTTGRYLIEMTNSEITACNEAFGDLLVKMGYEL